MLAVTEQMRPAHSHLGPADERLALYVLNTLPQSIGIPRVPEHVETRRLFNRLMPGLEQVTHKQLIGLLTYLSLENIY